MKRQIPYGVGNYEKIVDGNYYYVDKTAYIRELEKIANPVFLRPRRFGKTLWCSTLECYYDINRKDQFEHLFGRTAIGKNPTDRRNTMLALRFNFSVVDVTDTLEGLEASFNRNVYNAIGVFVAKYAAYADFSPALKCAGAVDMLATILSIAEQNHTPPLCVLVDEYDNFTNQLILSNRDTHYYAVTGRDSFFKNFFKTFKAGVEAQTIGFIYITGVLPITIDDLTSGYNIASIITLRPDFISMLGFTHDEMHTYLDEIFADNGWDEKLKTRVYGELKDLYDGYRLLPAMSEGLFNSTVSNYYLNELVQLNGKIPLETTDDNIKTDKNWIRRLVRRNPESLKIIDLLVSTGHVGYNSDAFVSRFNANEFFEARYLTVGFYYLGILTFENDFMLTFPNTTMKRIFTEYYNDIAEIRFGGDEQMDINETFMAFLKNGDWSKVYAAFAKYYLSLVPATAYDKANENLFRTSFYFYCARSLARYLLVTIEKVLPSGKADFVAIPRLESSSREATVIEFKYYKNEDAVKKGVLNWTTPPTDVVEQVERYKKDLQVMYPNYNFTSHVIVVAGTKGYKFF